jgi:hypothetical protein
MTMDSTKTRMVVVAVVVCGFAVGMAGLLNYFKYRATANRIVAERMVVTGKAVEGSIQSALELGLQFADIATLPGTLDRERATDQLIEGIDVFDTDGKLLYSTDRMRANRPVPEAWLSAARKAGSEVYWFVEADQDAAAGISVKNNFGLTIGYLALRYSHDRVREEASAVGRQLALMTLAMFVLSASLSAVALLAVMRRLTLDVGTVEQALRSGTSTPAFLRASRGPFGRGLTHFVQTTREVDTRIAELRVRLQRGANP